MNYFYFYPYYFNVDSLVALSISFLFFMGGFYFLNKKIQYTKLFLFLGGVSIAYFSCSLDNFLHDWDEQYHALVSKNMGNDPFNPVLYKNALFVPDIPSWSASHIWLHKQPLFMWQMAASIKLFGVNELALRLPSLIAHGFLLILLFDIGKYLRNEKTGLILAFVFAYMRFPLIYLGGMEATDHNDYIFLFYVTASFWAFFKSQETEKIKYVILTGVFVGCAVLVKWLTGFLIIGVWGLYALLYERNKIVMPLIALGVGLLIAIPWQLYCFIKYKTIFLQEMHFNTKHISEALEGHSGSWYFHFTELENLYTDDIFIFFILGISVVLFSLNKSIDFKKKFFVLVSIGMVYLFFSFVKTKMPAFCIIVIPLVMATVVISIQSICEKIKSTGLQRYSLIVVTVFLASYLMNPSYFLKRHTLFFRPAEQGMAKQLYNKAIISSLQQNLRDQKIAIINAGDLAVKIMFYTDFDATNIPLNQDKVEQLKKEGYKVIALYKETLPAYLKDDKDVIKI